MSLFDILNSDKDRTALNAVIDHAVQALTNTLIPAAKQALIEVIDHAMDRLDQIIVKANGSVSGDVDKLREELGQTVKEGLAGVGELLSRLDGATVALNLGSGKPPALTPIS